MIKLMTKDKTNEELKKEIKELREKVKTLAEILKALTKNIPKSHSLSKAMKDQDLIYSVGKNDEFPIS